MESVHGIPDKVHFIGIGGAGMSGLARVLLEKGLSVRGSDLNSGPATQRLQGLGAAVYRGHDAANLKDAQLVVVSTAIRAHNPELAAAKAQNIPVIHRAELLGRLMQAQKGLAVAGTHGKTTTSAMLALVLEKCGLDPSILVGGVMKEFDGNAKWGQGRYLVAEADESDGSLLKLHPHLALVTNIDEDHLDYYGSLGKITDTFRQFLQSIDPDGAAVLCFDDVNIREAAKSCRCPVISYALDDPQADYYLQGLQLTAAGSEGEVRCRGKLLGRLALTVPGRHNLANALGVLATAHHLGIAPPLILEQLRLFQGTGRRYQFMGRAKGIEVVDDYAHHPTEIQATLQAARQSHPGRVIAVFQPHRYTRTKALYQRFGTSFAQAHLVIVNDIYSAGEKPIAGVGAELIADAVAASQGGGVLYLADAAATVGYLLEHGQPGDLVLTMGAGDVWKTGLLLLERLKEMPD